MGRRELRFDYDAAQSTAYTNYTPSDTPAAYYQAANVDSNGQSHY